MKSRWALLFSDYFLVARFPIDWTGGFNLDNHSLIEGISESKVFYRIKNLFAKRPVKVRVITRDPFRLTVSEWRDDVDLCRAARNAFTVPVVRQALDTLRNTHYAGYALSPEFNIEQRAIEAAKCEGYGMALNDLESLAVHREPIKEVTADYAPENMELET